MERKSATTKVRNWCFTLNNWTEDELKKIIEEGERVNTIYMIAGKEVGEEGTKHIQGYIAFKNPRVFKGVKESLGDRIHLEMAKGTGFENYTYCSKDNDFIERGTRPDKVGQGKRNDLIDIKKKIYDEGKGIKDCIEDNLCMNFQQLRFAESLLKYAPVKKREKPMVYWFWGKPGSGKSKKAETMAPDAWRSGKNLSWWEGYDGHEDVIIDDFRGDFCKFHELLLILDRYPYRVEIKGGSRQLVAKRIFITSSHPPWSVYRERGDEDLLQLTRRIDVVEKFGDDGKQEQEQETEVGGNTCSPTFANIK